MEGMVWIKQGDDDVHIQQGAQGLDEPYSGEVRDSSVKTTTLPTRIGAFL
jgi:hypothetical protein